MSAYPERTLNVLVTTTLTIVQRDAEQVETNADADTTPTAEIRVLGVLVLSIAAASVTHSATGVYSFTWTPANLGLHVITWAYTLGAEAFPDGDSDDGDYTSVEHIEVVSDVAGTSDSVGADSAAADGVPDIGAANSCRVTGQFYDASGNVMVGVYVRFTPTRDTTQFLSSGTVASQVDAQSDATGAFEMYLVRGVTGTIAVTGIGLVRQVTVPDTGTISLKDLVETGDDPLEVQRPQFKKLPRRS